MQKEVIKQAFFSRFARALLYRAGPTYPHVLQARKARENVRPVFLEVFFRVLHDGLSKRRTTCGLRAFLKRNIFMPRSIKNLIELLSYVI